ncbi:MAG: hypothetical protein ACJ790_15870 [Myxococcaceae bacterium]
MRPVLTSLAVLALISAAGCGSRAHQTTPVADDSASSTDQAVRNPPMDASADPDQPDQQAHVQPDQDAGVTLSSCPAAQLLHSLGKSRLLFGAKMSDAYANTASWDLRYIYLAGTISDGANVCAACGSCTSDGVTCSNEGPGCGWWGCWQDAAIAPGQHLRSFLAKAKAANQLPLVSYYTFFNTSGLAEGPGELASATNVQRMSRYFADYRFALQQIGSAVAFVHLEPDLWGYAEQLNPDPSKIPVAVSTGNPTDCPSDPNTFSGFGRCMVAMARKYAPNAKVGLQASGWGSGTDVIFNRTPGLDVTSLGTGTANFLASSGGREADFVVLETSWDAAWYDTQGVNRWLDATNQTLPNFHQLLTWASAVTATLNKPAMFWQTPVGNLALPNVSGAWKDNRVDYFFDHPDELAKAGVFGAVFGSGGDGMTEPENDQGNLRSRFNGYLAKGGEAPCP